MVLTPYGPSIEYGCLGVFNLLSTPRLLHLPYSIYGFENYLFIFENPGILFTPGWLHVYIYIYMPTLGPNVYMNRTYFPPLGAAG